MPSSYEVAVPSHSRGFECGSKTLRLLADRGVSGERVRVFVTPGQERQYSLLLDPGLYASVETGGTGVNGQTNAIARHYAEGVAVVHIDDDILDVRRKVDDKKHEAVEDLDDLFTRAFKITTAMGASLWGVYPVLNALFMKDTVRKGLWFCIGQLWGVINTHDPSMEATVSCKVDYERTLLCWQRDGAVVRFDNVAPKTKMYAPGGMQAADRPDRRALNTAAVNSLRERWPNQVKIAARVNERIGAEVRLVNR